MILENKGKKLGFFCTLKDSEMDWLKMATGIRISDKFMSQNFLTLFFM